MVPVWNIGGPVSAEAGEGEVVLVVGASCGTPLAFGGPSTFSDGAGAGDERRRRHRRAAADQVLVIEERSAEGPLEEVVGQNVLLRERVQLGLAVVPVTHRQTAGVLPRGELIVGAPVDLHDVLEEPMRHVARHVQRGQQRAAVRDESRLDAERRVRQVVGLRLRSRRSGSPPASRRPRSAAAWAARSSRRDPSGECRRRLASRSNRRPSLRPLAPGKLPKSPSKLRFSA